MERDAQPSSYAAPTASKFYILEDDLSDVKQELRAHQLFDRPTYALIGPSRNMVSRIVSLMFPARLNDQGPNKTYVIALGGWNRNTDPSKFYSYTIVTDQYELIEPSDVDPAAVWSVPQPTQEASIPVELFTDNPQKLKGRFNAFYMLPNNIEATVNGTGKPLVVSHLVLPAAVPERELGVYFQIQAIGYTPDLDKKFDLITGSSALLFDDTLLNFRF